MVYSTFHISLQFPPLNYELIRQPVLLKVAYDFHSETFFPNKHLEQLRYESFQANLSDAGIQIFDMQRSNFHTVLFYTCIHRSNNLNV